MTTPDAQNAGFTLPADLIKAMECLCAFAERQLANGYDGYGSEELHEAAKVVRAVFAPPIPLSALDMDATFLERVREANAKK